MGKKYNKEALLSEFRTGAYTQRDLAHRHKISQSLVCQVTKGIEKDLRTTVIKKVEVDQEIKKLTTQELISVDEIANKEIKRLEKAKKIGEYLDGAVSIAAKKAVDILLSGDVVMNDVVGFGKFQNDARVGLGLQPKFASTVINNTNAQQQTSRINIVDV